MSSVEGSSYKRVFNGEGFIDKVVVDIAKGLAEAKITPQDLSNPVAFQLAFSRLYKALLKSMEGGGQESYVAEVRFRDDLGNEITFTVDLGSEVPPFFKRNVKARVVVELYEEEEYE